MKVTTDACLFGAVVVDEIKNSTIDYTRTLDIGTGTGLLSLMIAQLNDVNIDAIEIEKDAAQQALENVSASPYKQRINVIPADLNQFKTANKYNLIVTNPPFFEDDLKSPDQNKNLAKHDGSLTLIQLLNSIASLLKEEGIFAVLLPFHRSTYFTTEAAKLDLYLTKNISVKQSETHDYFRSILFFSRTKTMPESWGIIIKTRDGKYTEKFISLLKDYYLYF